jgi:hypothetical protein
MRFFRKKCENYKERGISTSAIVDRLPSSFVNNRSSFAALLGDQIDRYWPTSGLNLLFDGCGQVNGFFDGKFLYLFHVHRDLKTFSIASCIVEKVLNDERVRRINALVQSMNDDNRDLGEFFLTWTSRRELILRREHLEVDLVQHDHLGEFQKVSDLWNSFFVRFEGKWKKLLSLFFGSVGAFKMMQSLLLTSVFNLTNYQLVDSFMATAHKILNAIKRSEETWKRRCSKRSFFSIKTLGESDSHGNRNDGVIVRSIRRVFSHICSQDRISEESSEESTVIKKVAVPVEAGAGRSDFTEPKEGKSSARPSMGRRIFLKMGEEEQEK